MLVLSDVVVTFRNSIVVLTPNGQFWGCVNTASWERFLVVTFHK